MRKDNPNEWNLQKVDTDSINKISLVGHSMGTTQIVFGIVRLKEFFEQNVNFIVLLAPVVKFTNPTPFMRLASDMQFLFKE